VPLADAEPCPISLCTREGEQSALIAALRRANRVVRESSRSAPSGS
jgi:hypothetical protein